MTSSEISLQQCSPDFQYQVQEQRRRLVKIADWSISVFTLTCATVVVVQPLNNAARGAISFLQGTKQQIDPAAKLADPKASAGEKLGAIDKLISPDFKSHPTRGEKVAGYEVTSLFGPRSRPCPSCSDFHRGVDLGTPIGTGVYAIGSPGSMVKVECKQDTGGGGLYAVQTTPEFPDLSFESLHLSNCAEGNQPAGSVIARSGNSGTGTGAHLHFQVRRLSKKGDADGGLYAYEKFWLFWAVQGNPPTSLLGKVEVPKK
jgi:murein DD-endopeptidase MepM/ murein hydrolase activator NlpD